MGHVFHNITGFKPEIRPGIPEKGIRSNNEYISLIRSYEESMKKWIEGEIEARNVLVNRTSKEICPQNVLNMTAKQLYDHVTNVHEEGAMTPYETAVKNLFMTRFTSSAENYCNEFMQNYLDVNSAAKFMIRSKADMKAEAISMQSEFKIP